VWCVVRGSRLPKAEEFETILLPKLESLCQTEIDAHWVKVFVEKEITPTKIIVQDVLRVNVWNDLHSHGEDNQSNALRKQTKVQRELKGESELTPSADLDSLRQRRQDSLLELKAKGFLPSGLITPERRRNFQFKMSSRESHWTTEVWSYARTGKLSATVLKYLVSDELLNPRHPNQPM
jgi:hypothetical protein